MVTSNNQFSSLLTTNTNLEPQQQDQQQWQVVLRQSTGKVVLYHSNSNRLSVHHSIPIESQQPQDNSLQLSASTQPVTSRSLLKLNKHQTTSYCPLCLQSLNILPIPISTNAQSTSKQPDSQPNSSFHSQRSSNNPHFPRSALPPQPITDPQQSTHTVTQHSYFNLLSQSNSPLTSRPLTPIELSPVRSSSSSISSLDPRRFPPQDASDPEPEPLGQDKRVDGYYERFFIEVMKLGRGQKGSVFLCTHTLDGNALGDYAIKKIAVGQSSHELMHVLNEVKFLESLRHPNITQYHHAWIEKAQLSRFGPRVPVLYILMNFANGGTLDDYIAQRKGSKSTKADTYSPSSGGEDEDLRRRKRQKERFRQMTTSPKGGILPGLMDSLSAWQAIQQSSENPGKSTDRAVHLFGFGEIFNIFEDTCRGLGFLHSQGILHHDLKTENVLLHWASEDAMIPTALISDFGSSISQSENWSRERTGRTGTLDWVPPESLKKDSKTGKLNEVTQKGDLWQLGLVLHCLCFFRLPYYHSEDIDLLKDEIIHYPGFLIHEYPTEQGRTKRKMNISEAGQHSSRSDLPRAMLKLLSDLLCLDPRLRPSCERVLRRLEKIREAMSQDSLCPQKSTVVVSEADVGPAVGPLLGGSALVKRRRIFIEPSEVDTGDAVLSSHELDDQAGTKELSIVPGSSSSSSPSTYRHSTPIDNRRFVEPQDEPLNSPRYLHLPSPTNSRFRPPRTPHHLSRLSLSRTIFRRILPSSLFAPFENLFDRFSDRWLAVIIGLFICLKSVILIQVFATQSTKSSSSSSSSDHHLDQNLDPPLDQFLVLVLIVFNTFELLICHPLMSIILTVIEVLWVRK